MHATPTTVTLRYFEGCPNWRTTDRDLEGLRDEYGFALVRQRVETEVEAARLGFLGSPTVLIDDVDPFAVGGEPTGLACRVYATEDGLRGAPSREALRAALS